MTNDFPANPLQIRRHFRLLLLATILVQGIMFISYPLGTGSKDDNESAQRFLIGEYAAGNYRVGNVRYNTGYAFVMAPVATLTSALGRLAERALLLLQMLAYSTVPFMVYDMLRRRFNARAGLIAAVLVLLDPFGLQWVHFQLPGWMIALVTIAALWLAQLAWLAPMRRRFALIALAAIGLGLMSFARYNFAPLVALFGASFFLWKHIPLRQRFALFGMVGLISAGILAGYIVLIHIPSTGGTTLSCTAGATLVASLPEEGFAMRASNGPHSLRYAQLLTLTTERNLDFYADTYPLWRNPGPWVGEEERQAFLAQPFGDVQEEIKIVFPAALYFHLGPCAADALLYDVFVETVAQDPLKLVWNSISGVFYMLIQDPNQSAFTPQYLDNPEEITWQGEGWLGFTEAFSARYNGHRLWRPGVILYSSLFPLLNIIKLLTPLALIATFWRRDWLLVTVSGMLLLGLLLISTAATTEPRYYASLAPLFMILIGWLLADLLRRHIPSE